MLVGRLHCCWVLSLRDEYEDQIFLYIWTFNVVFIHDIDFIVDNGNDDDSVVL